MTTAVMVHGAFCGGWTFERFRGPFEVQGWTVLAPDLPGHAADAAAGATAGLSMGDYAEALVRTCRELPEPPVLVGHSMGALVCQMAARRVRPRALVLIAPSPPWGVATSSVEEAVAAASTPLLDPFWSGVVAPDAPMMRRYSLDRMPKPEREAIVARMRPESARALREVLNWWLDPFMTTSVGPGPLPAPAVCLVGEHDKVHTPETVRQTARRIGAACEVLPGMSHWLIGEPGWEGTAERALAWLAAQGRAAA